MAIEIFSSSLITAIIGAVVTFVLVISITPLVGESFRVVVLVSSVGSIVTFLTLLVALLVYFKYSGSKANHNN